MRRRTRRGWLLLGALALSAVGACTSGEPSAEEIEAQEAVSRDISTVQDTATRAATDAGTRTIGGMGGDATGQAFVSLGGFTGGATYGAFAACSGGGSVGLDVAGTAYDLECDGAAHRVGSLVLDHDVAEVEVTRPNDVPSVWGVMMTVD